MDGVTVPKKKSGELSPRGKTGLFEWAYYLTHTGILSQIGTELRAIACLMEAARNETLEACRGAESIAAECYGGNYANADRAITKLIDTGLIIDTKRRHPKYRTPIYQINIPMRPVDLSSWKKETKDWSRSYATIEELSRAMKNPNKVRAKDNRRDKQKKRGRKPKKNPSHAEQDPSHAERDPSHAEQETPLTLSENPSHGERLTTVNNDSINNEREQLLTSDSLPLGRCCVGSANDEEKGGRGVESEHFHTWWAEWPKSYLKSAKNRDRCERIWREKGLDSILGKVMSRLRADLKRNSDMFGKDGRSDMGPVKWLEQEGYLEDPYWTPSDMGELSPAELEETREMLAECRDDDTPADPVVEVKPRLTGETYGEMKRRTAALQQAAASPAPVDEDRSLEFVADDGLPF